MSEWQPIETAPKDGRESLCWTKECGQVVLYWDDFNHDEPRWSNGFDDDQITPTHWMPLPKPPQEQDR